MKTLFILLFFACSFGLCAQEWQQTSTETLKAILEKNARRFRSENYVLTFQTSIYKDLLSTETVTVDKQGMIIRGTGKSYRSDQGEQILLQNAEVKLLIDTSRHIIGLMPPDTLFDVIQTQQLLQNKGWERLVCETTTVKGKNVYRLSGESLEAYEYIELAFNNESGELLSMVLFFRPYNYFSDHIEDQTVEQPRIEIRYSAGGRLTDAHRKLLDLNEWVHKTTGSNYELSASKGSYRLEDYRITKSH